MGVVYVHYLAEDKAGPIRTKFREVSNGGHTVVLSTGLRYAVACQPDRKHLAVVKGKRVVEFFSATGDHRAVTCPKCMGTLAYQQKNGGS